MGNIELKNKVLELLKSSSISQHNKDMVNLLLPIMKDEVLQNIYNSLHTERSKLDLLEEKKKRVTLQYQVMVEKLSNSSEKSK